MAAFKKTKIYYKGFSTARFEGGSKSFALTDIELVKEDILNHIFTRPGERVMMPKFGTRIPDLAFEPLDRETISIVEEDIKKVIDLDPRVKLLSLNVYPLPNNHTIIAIVELFYLEFEVQDTLNIEVKIS